jgi:hypothetical protein
LIELIERALHLLLQSFIIPLVQPSFETGALRASRKSVEISNNLADSRIRLAPSEPTKWQYGHGRTINPRKLRVGPRRDHQQQAHVLYLLDDAHQQFKCGWIRPV